MAADNPDLIISVSAFGFGDSITINGRSYAEEALTPSVIIEDPSQKLYLYGERALHERSGAGLAFKDEGAGPVFKDDATCCTLVAVLWQQLKACTDMSLKQEAANRICKHVIQIICDLKPTIAADDELKALAPLLTRTNLRAKAQLVLLIPDNFTEVEQQCLLNAFLGFNLKLLWRSVAALMGAEVNPDQALLPQLPSNRIYSASGYREQRALVHVLYVGADSIDLSSYELKSDQRSNYLIPVRLQAVYQGCPLGLSYLHYAISAANTYARQITDDRSDITISGRSEQVAQSICQQLLRRNMNIWGIEQEDVTQQVVKFTVYGQTKWVQLPAVNRNMQLHQALNLTDIDRFYQRYHVAPQQPSQLATARWSQGEAASHPSNHLRQFPFAHSRATYEAPQSRAAYVAPSQEGSFIKQVAQAIARKMTVGGSGTSCVIVGPDQLVSKNAVFKVLKQLLEQLHLQFKPLPAEALSLGGMSFQDRLNRGLATYLDRLPKLSTFVTNETQDEYQERILIEEKEIEPQEEVSSSLNLQISAGAKWIDLYVSADPKFNQKAIDKATEISFKEQGISVKKAELAFNDGAEADADEPVTVSVMQRPLSGYVKIKISPQGASHVLPPYGVTCAFDPVKTPDFEDCIDALPRAYPPLTQTNNFTPDIKLVEAREADLVRQLKKAWIDKTATNRIVSACCRYVPDRPERVTDLCQLLLRLEHKLGKFHSLHLTAIRTLLEEHYRCFDPREPTFCMTFEFAQLMTSNSMNILQAALTEVKVPDLIKTEVVKGSKKLSISLIILMYSLMFRRLDRNYLTSERELQYIKALLHKVERHYEQALAELLTSHQVTSRFRQRFHDFVNNSLKTLIPQVIEYLEKKGTNINIMAAINALDVEGDKD